MVVQRPAGRGSDHSFVVAVVGPTASGKSDLALHLARQCAGEIVNADAFALYRGMDVGTAKPGEAERRTVPHHCLDLLDLAEPASVAAFQSLARAAIADIRQRGRLAIVVGGSVLYVRAVCDELELPPRDQELRAHLQQEAELEGGAVLHQRLAELDPVAAAEIDPRNTRRVVRALEVVLLTGRFTARMPEPVAWWPTLWLALDWSRAELDERIEQRVQQMWATRLLAETEVLLRAGLADSPTAAHAIGYREAMAVLAGQLDEETAIAETVRATKRLARRQARAFRRDPRITWLPPPDAAARAEALLCGG